MGKCAIWLHMCSTCSTYSTLDTAAAVARTASTPRTVCLHCPNITSGESDVFPSGLTPTELTRYQRALPKGEFLRLDGTEPTESEWLAKLNSWQSQLCGTQEVVTSSGAMETQVMGEKIYLPNINFCLVPNFTPLGKLYNLYKATFCIPQLVAKTDVCAYLAAVYGVQCQAFPCERAWDGHTVVQHRPVRAEGSAYP